MSLRRQEHPWFSSADICPAESKEIILIWAPLFDHLPYEPQDTATLAAQVLFCDYLFPSSSLSLCMECPLYPDLSAGPSSVLFVRSCSSSTTTTQHPSPKYLCLWIPATFALDIVCICHFSCNMCPMSLPSQTSFFSHKRQAMWGAKNQLKLSSIPGDFGFGRRPSFGGEQRIRGKLLWRGRKGIRWRDKNGGL